MKLSEAKNRYCFQVKVNLVDAEGNPTEDYVIFREPNMKEMSKMSEDEKENQKLLEELFPVCLVDSSFTDDAGNKANSKDVCELLGESPVVYKHVMEQWLQNCPFFLKNQKREN